MKKVLAMIIVTTMLLTWLIPLAVTAQNGSIQVEWTVYKYSGVNVSSVDAGDTYNGQKRYFVAYASGGLNTLIQGETASFSSTEGYASPRIAHVTFTTPDITEGQRVFLNITGYTRTTFKSSQGWIKLTVTDAVSSNYDKARIKYDESVKYYAGEKGEGNANPAKRISSIDVTDFLTEGKTKVYVSSPTCGIYIEDLNITVEDDKEMKKFYEKGSHADSYNAIIKRGADSSSRAWRDGFVSGNGVLGYVTSGEPYSDTFVFQHNFYNFPTSEPREVSPELTSQLEEARQSVINKDAGWIIKDANGNKRNRTRLYAFHPGHQLRLESSYKAGVYDYRRWVNYETAETGVYYNDKYGEWERVSFTSREDDVSITKMSRSSEGELLNLTVSIDDINDTCKATGNATYQKYKKITAEDGSYVAMVAKYPSYTGSEQIDGGYGGVTYIIAEGEGATKTKVDLSSSDSMLVGTSSGVKIENAENVYLITTNDRTFNMTGAESNHMSAFEKMSEYDLLDDMLSVAEAVRDKYTTDGKFSYEDALEPSKAIQSEEFNSVELNIGDTGYDTDNDTLIAIQKQSKDSLDPMFVKKAYEAARYGMICTSGVTAPKLYGMWTGEWNPPWNAIYTTNANVNVQVSGMNTSNLTLMQQGYITFFLRNTPDYMENARVAYGMHDAIMMPHNVDADRAPLVQYDNAYPLQYWNAGASWALLPIYEYWQCYGNRQIAINDYMRIDDLKTVLSVNDGGLTDEEFEEIKERGYLDLEKDILLPLLTKQANFWEQIVTAEYYMDANGRAKYKAGKTELEEGEKYIIIPTYSPENKPSGYGSAITMNATMDIAAARDGLDMICAIEKAIGREGSEETIAKWTKLKNDITGYMFDSDGALKEWSSDYYQENNNHRHLSHLYPAWPGYETQNDKTLANAASIAVDNRSKFNTGDATGGFGWIHKALVGARLKDAETVSYALGKMMSSNAYYSSLLTDHDTNRGNGAFCTDTAFGSVGAVNEAFLYSNTGEVQILPAVPFNWDKGEIKGLMARSRVEAESITWNRDEKKATVTLLSLEDENTVRLSCGEAWDKASINGVEQEVTADENGNYITLTLNEGESETVTFSLIDIRDATFVAVDGMVGKEFSLKQGTYKLSVVSSAGNVTGSEWRTDSIAHGVVLQDGTLNVYKPGIFTVTCTTSKGFDAEATITVEENAISEYINNPITGFKACDTGYSSSWSPEFVLDGKMGTTYSSKDNTNAKYFSFELEEARAVNSLFIVGRYTSNEPEGHFAKFINGAKVYASNEEMNSVTDLGTADYPLVGEVSGITATGEYIPGEVKIDTKGEKYKYYILYFDTMNNYNNTAISFGFNEINFYTIEDKVSMTAEKLGGDVKVSVVSKIEGKYKMILGSFTGDILDVAAVKEVEIKKGENLPQLFENVSGNELSVFLWDYKLRPICENVDVE
ncbi:MAG: glycoside hydrolase N-terminal domain-containing protein [Clostridia bacterium]|nr:glycoside hydrolase N-terminal domain-containing protein [Clostridia bacterium]